MPPKLPLSAIVLAGGQSSRMGRDKALLPYGEKTMLEHTAHLARNLFAETLIVVNDLAKIDKLELKGCKIYEDLFKQKGPLAGIYTGLVYSKNPANCILTCDMPLLDEEILRRLVEFWEKDFDVLCLEDPQGRLQPFPGIYLRSAMPLIHLLLERGENSMRHFLEIAMVKPLVIQQEQIRVLTNMNTVEDYYWVLKEKKERV